MYLYKKDTGVVTVPTQGFAISLRRHSNDVYRNSIRVDFVKLHNSSEVLLLVACYFGTW